MSAPYLVRRKCTFDQAGYIRINSNFQTFEGIESPECKAHAGLFTINRIATVLNPVYAVQSAQKAVIRFPVSGKEAGFSAPPSHSNCLCRHNRPAKAWSRNRDCLLGRGVDAFGRRKGVRVLTAFFSNGRLHRFYIAGFLSDLMTEFHSTVRSPDKGSQKAAQRSP